MLQRIDCQGEAQSPHTSTDIDRHRQTSHRHPSAQQCRGIVKSIDESTDSFNVLPGLTFDAVRAPAVAVSIFLSAVKDKDALVAADTCNLGLCRSKAFNMDPLEWREVC